MIRFRPVWFSLFVAVATLLGPVILEAGKKKEKAEPVKIIKASETRYKGAKIISPSESKAKKKGFLWFRKKEPKTLDLKEAKLVRQSISPSVMEPEQEPDLGKRFDVEEGLDEPKVEVPELVKSELVDKVSPEEEPILPKKKASEKRQQEAVPEKDVEVEAP